MKAQLVFGIMFLIGAAIMLFLANDASHSLSDQVSNVFTGHFTERTTWLFAGGIAAGLLGLAMLLFGGRRQFA